MFKILIAVAIGATLVGQATAAPQLSCAAVTSLMAHPDQLVHKVGAERLLSCTGRVLIWEHPYIVKDVVIPGHWTFYKLNRDRT